MIILYLLFCLWLIFFNIIVSIKLPQTPWFFCFQRLHCILVDILDISHILYYLSGNGHLCCFYILTIILRIALNYSNIYWINIYTLCIHMLFWSNVFVFEKSRISLEQVKPVWSQKWPTDNCNNIAESWFCELSFLYLYWHYLSTEIGGQAEPIFLCSRQIPFQKLMLNLKNFLPYCHTYLSYILL